MAHDSPKMITKIGPTKLTLLSLVILGLVCLVRTDARADLERKLSEALNSTEFAELVVKYLDSIQLSLSARLAAKDFLADYGETDVKPTDFVNVGSGKVVMAAIRALTDRKPRCPPNRNSCPDCPDAGCISCPKQRCYKCPPCPVPESCRPPEEPESCPSKPSCACNSDGDGGKSLSKDMAELHSAVEQFEKDKTKRDQFLKIIQEIPRSTGGLEMQLADRILALMKVERYSVPVHRTTRANSREITHYTSVENSVAIIGRVLRSLIVRECSICDCSPPKFCEACDEREPMESCKGQDSKSCPKCPKFKFCPAPKNCHKYRPCPPCPVQEEGGESRSAIGADKFDVDPVNPVTIRELSMPRSCKGVHCKFLSTCGAAPLNSLTPKQVSAGYIVNGEDHRYGEWPSYVRLSLRQKDDTNAMCGGVLVSDRHVLTAGHCTQNVPKSITAYLADSSLYQVDEHEVVRAVAKICQARNYMPAKDKSGTKYDFAVLTLAKPVQFNDYIQPACLPYKPISIKSSKCFAVGQGTIGMGSLSDPFSDLPTYPKVLQKLRVKQASCEKWALKDDDRSRHCFTKLGSNGDTCNGDSGGPILCLSGGRWNVVGLTSYGSYKCDGKDIFGWVAVYARVQALMDYIEKDCLSL